MKEIFRAAFVVGRRDLTAIIFSKAFIFFLLGPLFPVIVAVAAGGIGGQVARDVDRPIVGVALSNGEGEQLIAARTELAKVMGEHRFPELKLLKPGPDGSFPQPRDLIADKQQGLVAVISGSLAKPMLTATRGKVDSLSGPITLMSGYAASGSTMALPKIDADIVAHSTGDSRQQQLLTAQAAQALMFMLTMLLAGMVLSNLVEEKSNKIIEILAASIPMESVFLGKLFAMLAMAFIGIFVWGALIVGALSIWAQGIPSLPAPAVGWPLFLTLAVVYFALAYLMLGAMFLGIGAMAATVREVQTISMPVTMAQLMVFFLAIYTVARPNDPVGIFASIFPFSSPFTMIARAAQSPTLWYHALAIVGQILFAALVLRIGVYLFKRNVMKSGSAGRVDADGRRKLFGLIRMRS